MTSVGEIVAAIQNVIRATGALTAVLAHLAQRLLRPHARSAQLVNIRLAVPHLALLALLESTREAPESRLATFVLQVKLQTVQRVLLAPIAPRALI